MWRVNPPGKEIKIYQIKSIQIDDFKDYRDHDFSNTEFFYFLTIDTRQ